MENVKIFASCHNHSCFSDADYTPEYMAQLAYNLGHGGIILTDHDTVSGTYFMNRAAREYGMKSILGCEFSTYYGDIGVHLLGFDFNPDNAKMRDLLAYCSSIQTRRSEILYNWGIERGTLRDGMPWQSVLDDNPYNDYICNNQAFKSLVKRGIYKEDEYLEFFDNNFSSTFVSKNNLSDKLAEATGRSYKEISTERVVKTIIEAGGVPVVAHPHGFEKIAGDFIKMGVMGFETRHPDIGTSRHPDYPINEHAFYENLCDEHGLYKMGGSDHSGVLGGNIQFSKRYDCEYGMSGITEEDFMKIYERRLG